MTTNSPTQSWPSGRTSIRKRISIVGFLLLLVTAFFVVQAYFHASSARYFAREAKQLESEAGRSDDVFELSMKLDAQHLAEDVAAEQQQQHFGTCVLLALGPALLGIFLCLRRLRTPVAVCLLLFSAGRIYADDSRAFDVIPRNDESEFLVGVSVDQDDAFYQEGDEMHVRVRLTRDAYLYLFYRDVSGSFTCLFPNQYQTENFVSAGEVVSVPSDDDSFRFRCRAPFGAEELIAVATTEPVNVFPYAEATKSAAAPLSADVMKQMQVELKGQDERNWAEARIDITTAAEMEQTPMSRRVALAIGISDYLVDEADIAACDRDAWMMARALQELCGVDEAIVLVNEDATHDNIQRAILDGLTGGTRPGDTVFLFFSGHGGQTEDSSGDEADGLDEFLVPYDGDQLDTMILDDVFAQWMQALAGRHVMIILDNCFAGGSTRSLIREFKEDGRLTDDCDFLESELRQVKEISQLQTTVLASSQPHEVSWVMEDGSLSVFTHFLLQSLADESTDLDGDGRLTPTEVHSYVAGRVSHYVQVAHGEAQEPVVYDNARPRDSFVIRP